MKQKFSIRNTLVAGMLLVSVLLLCACQEVEPAPSATPEASSLDLTSLTCTTGPTCMYVSQNYFDQTDLMGYDGWIYFFFSLSADPALSGETVAEALHQGTAGLTLYDAQEQVIAAFDREDMGWAVGVADDGCGVTLHVSVRDARALGDGPMGVRSLRLSLADGGALSFSLPEYILCTAVTDSDYSVSQNPLGTSPREVDGGYEITLTYGVVAREGATALSSAELVFPDAFDAGIHLLSSRAEGAPERPEDVEEGASPAVLFQYPLLLDGTQEQSCFLRPLLRLTLADGSTRCILPAVPVQVDRSAAWTTS